jgi:hypothetical protein
LQTLVAPEHAPPHDEKTQPLAGVAVNVIESYMPALQILEQLRPLGVPKTVPSPENVAIESVYGTKSVFHDGAVKPVLVSDGYARALFATPKKAFSPTETGALPRK